MPFEINGRRFLLTYSQYDVDSQVLLDHLGTLGPVSRAIIGRELHADGGRHSHVAIEYGRRLQSRQNAFFDHDGHHPNIEPARTWAAIVQYARKDGDTLYFGCTEADCRDGGDDRAQPGQDGPTGAGAFVACQSANGLREWFEWTIDNKLAYAYAKAVWDIVHGVRAPTYFERPVGGVIEFALDARHVGGDDRTVVVLGPSGIGKTTWALREAPLPFLLVTDVDDLGHFDAQVHKSIVFDEIRCTGDAFGKGAWPLTAQIKLLTWDTPVSVRIRHKLAHLPAHVVKIFTCTDTYPFTRDQQIERRMLRKICLYDEGHNCWQ